MISNLSEIPPNWIKVRFDEIAENITDRIEKPNESGLDYYIGLEHLDTDQIRIKRFGSTDDVKATKYLCKKGDIIFGKRRAYLRKVAVTDRDAVASAHSMVIRPKGDLIVLDFLPCFMQSSVFWKTAHAISEGSMSSTIKWRILAKQEFWIPSVEEQRKMADVLWAIEDNAEKIETLVYKSTDMKKGIVHELFTKGIGHTNLKNCAIGVIPVDWNIAKVENVCEILDNKRVPIEKAKRQKGNVPYYGATGLLDHVKDYLFDEELLLVGEDGADWSGFANTSYIVNGKTWINNHAHVLRCKKIEIYFLKEYFNYKDLGHYISGTTRGKLTKKDLVNIKLPLPPIEEQRQIANILSSIDVNIDINNKHLNNIVLLKKKLTDEFLKGEVQV